MKKNGPSSQYGPQARGSVSEMKGESGMCQEVHWMKLMVYRLKENVPRCGFEWEYEVEKKARSVGGKETSSHYCAHHGRGRSKLRDQTRLCVRHRVTKSAAGGKSLNIHASRLAARESLCLIATSWLSIRKSN